jgi:hypothetical protein
MLKLARRQFFFSADPHHIYYQHLSLATVADFNRDNIQFGGPGNIIEVDY